MITELAITKPDVAKAVLDVQLPSYRIEAQIIDYEEIPPLKDTVETLQQCGESFYGYYAGNELTGVISFKIEEDVIDIHRLVVHPNHFRQGIAKKLLDYVEGLKIKRNKIIVSTGTKNTPAVNFYLKNGFVIVKEIKVSEQLSLTSLEKQRIEGNQISLRLVRDRLD
ncbi:MAG: GNAT family N-acetyltransferase [Candidatus Pristimantibacillus sp.]